MPGTTRVSRYQKDKTRKVKTNLDLLEQEIVSGSGICKSAPHPRQSHQHPTTQFFTGWMPFLLPNQQRQSTEGNSEITSCVWQLAIKEMIMMMLMMMMMTSCCLYVTN